MKILPFKKFNLTQNFHAPITFSHTIHSRVSFCSSVNFYNFYNFNFTRHQKKMKNFFEKKIFLNLIR